MSLSKTSTLFLGITLCLMALGQNSGLVHGQEGKSNAVPQTQKVELRDDESALTLYIDGRELDGPPTLQLTAAWSGGQREPWKETIQGADDGKSPLDDAGDKLYLALGRVPRAEFLAITLIDSDGETLGARRTPLPSSQTIRLLITPKDKGVLELQLLEPEGPAPTLKQNNSTAPPDEDSQKTSSKDVDSTSGMPFGPWALLWTILLGSLAILAIRRSYNSAEIDFTPADNQCGQEGLVNKPGFLFNQTPLKHASSLRPLFGVIALEKQIFLSLEEHLTTECTLDLAIEITSQGASVLLLGKNHWSAKLLMERTQTAAFTPQVSSLIRWEADLKAASKTWIQHSNPVTISTGAFPGSIPGASLQIHIGTDGPATKTTPIPIVRSETGWCIDNNG